LVWILRMKYAAVFFRLLTSQQLQILTLFMNDINAKF